MVQPLPDEFISIREADEKAKEIVATMEDDLGRFFSIISCVCDPEMFIIGGGMTKSADKFLPGVIEAFRKYSHTAVHDTPFVIAGLEEPGVVGAAMVPLSHEA